MEGKNYDDWVNKKIIKERFDKSLKKRKYLFLVPLFFYLTVFSFILVIIPPFVHIIKYLFIFALILSSSFIILVIYLNKLPLTKKEFLVYSFYTMSKWVREEDYEDKKMKELVKILMKMFNKTEIEGDSNIFNYSKIYEFKKDLINLMIYLNNQLIEGNLSKFSNILYDLSIKIFNEELEGPFLDKIQKAHGGSLDKKQSSIFIFLKKKWKYGLAFILFIGLIIYAIIAQISQENLFMVIGGSLFIGIILWLLTSNKK